MARKVLKGLQGEQKDIGKLKQNNEILKKEMQTLKAMLAAQAKEGASNELHKKEIEEREKKIAVLEKRIAALEKELAAEKQTVEKLEADLEVQKQMARQSIAAPASPQRTSHVRGSSTQLSASDLSRLSMPTMPANYVSPEVVEKHKKHVARLEEQLNAERNQRLEADGEIIRLRAAVSGIHLNEAEINAMVEEKKAANKKAAEARYVPFSWSYYVSSRAVAGIRSQPKAYGEKLLLLISFLRFFVSVVLALLVNLLIFAFVVQRRMSGGHSKLLMRLLFESLSSNILNAIV